MNAGGPVEAKPSEAGEASSKEAWKYGLPAYANKVTRGGGGGEIIRVRSLNSTGPGTLRAALSASGPRMVVFEVGGAIDLAGESLVIDNPHVTIAGQTAPSPGISLLRGGITIVTHDVIVQHVRVRPGDLGEAPLSGRDIDGLTTWSGYNVVVDHCSLTWGTDENLSASGPRFSGETPEDWVKGTSRNILFSNNLIAEGLANSTHAKGEHSKGSLIHDHVSDIVIYRNLYSSNFERSPLFKGGVRGSIINNFIYNPGQRAVHYNLQALEWAGQPQQMGHMDLVSNVMRAGPSTASGLPLLTVGGEGGLSLYTKDNIAVDRWGRDLPLFGHYTVGKAKIVNANKAYTDLKQLEIMKAQRLEAYILGHVGSRPWDRDLHDNRVLADAAEGRSMIIDSQSEVGGYPKFDIQIRSFKASDWYLETMTPKHAVALDAKAGAHGT
ncbi:MAG: right-handed parallel beta-helix repeat-containing protein [Myxococcales bacterium]|nr:right-handed parallel beta-helix repeat-containing protein [Myxococcales bacterium]